MAAALPIIIAEIDKAGRERIRVSLDHYAGKNTIDVRIWYRAGDEWKPSRQGVTTAVERLPALADGLAAALDRARTEGLIE